MSLTDRALFAEVAQDLPMSLHSSLRCEAGELLALVGPSGAGKTSMMRVLAGLMRPQSGKVVVGGEVWCDTQQGIWLPPQRRHVGLVFQNYALMPHLSAQGNVTLSLLHLPPTERSRQARHWLDHVGLSADQQDRRPAALSGGQQQRVAVARALAREPSLLLLDEPFSAVDQMNRQGLYRLLADLRRELEIPIILVTHDLNEARMLADRLVVMDAGRVLQTGTPASIHDAPRNARVADLVGIHNRFQGVWLGKAGTTGMGRMRWVATTSKGMRGDAPVLTVRDKGRLPDGQEVTWVIPSDGITLLAPGAHAPGDFAAEVVEARHLGEITLATLALAAVPGAPLRLTLSGAQRQRLVAGARCWVRLAMDKVHVMPVRSP
ncbi:ABC transporter ATP-binding protein [Hydrogenophaga sp.]|uniref:ABC transporter ATP-binding protein n=1 Tax=Hydrogenophaga sp. TaxID=1904254 RepID=UPI002715DBAE|nr:ABC transporter ATP-binding protein [Hydrogenophaga sp.]MDO8906250.1 ABC transporter ATP-binding protein [Hydrogenophaga sp.]